MAESPNREGLRAGLAEVAAWGAEEALAPLCSTLLHGPPDLAIRAERALLLLAADHAGIAPRLLDPPGERSFVAAARRVVGSREQSGAALLDQALGEAMRQVRVHARRGVALAAAVFMDTPRRVAWRRARRRGRGAGLVDAVREGDGLDALVAVLRGSRRPIARLRAWEWLAEDGIGERVLERVRRASAPVEHELVLARWHLVLHPRRMLALRRHAGRSRGRPTGMLPEAWVYPRLSADARQGMCALAWADPARASVALEGALVDSDVLVRLSAARHAPSRLAADLCFDACEQVSRSATLRVSGVGVDLPGGVRGGGAQEVVGRALTRLTRSPHESVRQIARQEEGRRLGCGTGWSAGVALREAMMQDREGTLERIRRLAREGPVEERAAVLLAARRAGLAEELEEDLAELLAAGTPGRVAATAATLLGDARSPRAVAALKDALGSPDARVRANVVQSLGRIATRERQGPAATLVRQLADERTPIHDHRTRANLVRAMIEAQPDTRPRALDELVAMLGDHRAGHRLAAVWLAGRCLAGERRRRLAESMPWRVSARLERLASEDDDERVRARAAACVARQRAEQTIRLSLAGAGHRD